MPKVLEAPLPEGVVPLSDVLDELMDDLGVRIATAHRWLFEPGPADLMKSDQWGIEVCAGLHAATVEDRPEFYRKRMLDVAALALAACAACDRNRGLPDKR